VLHELTGREAGLLSLLFPHLSGLDLDHVEDLDGSVKIVARTASGPVACRDCGTLPARVHDRYRRCLHDLACGGRSVLAGLEVRRLICDNPACPVATFAEQVEGLTARHQRRTAGLRSLLERVALALAGRAGSRLARVLGTVVSRFTLIRLVRAMPDPEIGQVTVPGGRRLGQAARPVVRQRPGGHGQPPRHRHLARPGGRDLRRLAPRTPWRPADLQRQSRGLCAGRPRGRARRPAGRRQVAHAGMTWVTT
jgi:hypothetical protein